MVVGGGISAVGLLDEISKVTTTSWFTRREPVWRDAAFDRQAGHDAVALVEERVRQGLPPQSVVAVTGLIWTPALRAAAARGVLERHPMFTGIEPGGVRMADGSFLAADVILWATGFRAELDTRPAAPARPRRRDRHGRHPGGRRAAGPSGRLRAVLIHIGANRAGRAAVAGIRVYWRSRISLQGTSISGPDQHDSHLTHKRRQLRVADNNLDSLFSRLRRFPDVEAANLQAWDATDKLLLDTAADLLAAGALHPAAGSPSWGTATVR